MAGARGGKRLAADAAGILLRGVDLKLGRKLPQGPYSKIPTPETAVTARPGFTPTPGRGGQPGSRPGQPFTPAGKDEVKQRNASGNNSGRAHCANCATPVVKPERSRRGERPPENEAQVDHVTAESRGGSGDPSNGACLCRACNRAKSNK